MPLMQLGDFPFETNTVPFETRARNISPRFEETERFMANNATQFTGVAEDISISGKVFPGVHGKLSAIKQLREMARSGQKYKLVSGTGEIWGNFIIKKLSENESEFFKDGMARKFDFTLDLSLA